VQTKRRGRALAWPSCSGGASTDEAGEGLRVVAVSPALVRLSRCDAVGRGVRCSQLGAVVMRPWLGELLSLAARAGALNRDTATPTHQSACDTLRLSICTPVQMERGSAGTGSCQRVPSTQCTLAMDRRPHAVVSSTCPLSCMSSVHPRV
jgi:hypothetical protein